MSGRSAKLLTEFVGSFVFYTTAALAGAAGPLAPVAIGSALMVMVYMGGHISGAHYNPAVTLAVFLRRKVSATTLISYWVVQLLAAAVAFGFGYVVSGHAAGIHPGKDVHAASALVVEVLFTAALALVVLNVAVTKATAGNSFYGLAIGFTIVVAAFVGGPIAGGAFNPAIGFGATLAAAAFGSGSWDLSWIYLVGPLLGAALAAGIHQLQVGAVEAADQAVTEFAPSTRPRPTGS